MTDIARAREPVADTNGKPFDEAKVERAAMLLVDLHPLLAYDSARRIVLCAGDPRILSTVPEPMDGAMDNKCAACKGTGADLSYAATCDYCIGTGKAASPNTEGYCGIVEVGPDWNDPPDTEE